MQLTRLVVTPLRLALGAAFVLLVVFQVMSIPGQFAHMAKEDPESAYLRWPLTIFFIVEVLCAQAVIVATWKLLTMVKNDEIFRGAALRWVDVIVTAIGVGWALLVGLFLFVGFNANDPGPIMVMSLFVIAVTLLGLLMIVMRALLQQATSLRTDMDEVL